MSEVQSQSTYLLPSEYGENKIMLMTRDPHCLYAYWEISNNKINIFRKELGNEIWERSVPALKITNISKNTSFFIKINDFSNSWYINVSDSDCLYAAEIGRKLGEGLFINIASSNYIATQQEKASSSNNAYFVNYKDLRNGKLDLESDTIYETYTKPQFGLSSPELSGINAAQFQAGLSSAELYSSSWKEQLGISSESMFLSSSEVHDRAAWRG